MRPFNRYPTLRLPCGVPLRIDLDHWKWSIIATRGHHEADVERFLSEYLRSGDIVIDAGANIGVITTVAARLVRDSGRVYAFEADRIFYNELKRTVARNALPNVQAENVALLDRSGGARFVRPEGAWGSFLTGSDKRQDSAVKRYFPNRDIVEFTSSATTLDAYLESQDVDQVQLIKIDVDGPELAVLRGAERTLCRHRPALIVEASMFYGDHGTTFEDVFEYLVALGYRLYAVRRGRRDVARLRTPSDLPVDIRHEKQAADVFCLPEDRPSRWDSLWFVARQAA